VLWLELRERLVDIPLAEMAVLSTKSSYRKANFCPNCGHRWEGSRTICPNCRAVWASPGLYRALAATALKLCAVLILIALTLAATALGLSLMLLSTSSGATSGAALVPAAMGLGLLGIAAGCGWLIARLFRAPD